MPFKTLTYKLIGFIQKNARLSKFQLIFFLSVCLSVTAFAQHKTIDSLNKVLPSLKDTARINCLNELSKYYCNYDGVIPHYARTDSAEPCAKQAQSEAEKINYKLGEGSAFLNLSKIYLRRWNYYTAQHYTEQAISVFKNIGAQRELAQAYSILVDVYLSECDNSSARKYAEMLLDYYKKIKDTTGESQAWESLNSLYIWQGNYDKAFECMQNEFNLLKNRSDSTSILSMLKTREGLYQFIGWDDSVASTAAKIVEYEKKTNITVPDTIDEVSQTGFKYFMEKKWDSSEYYYKKLHNYIESDKGIDSIIKERNILRNDIDLASVYQYEGRYKEALLMFKKALQYDRERNVSYEELEELLNISQIYDLEGKETEAIYYAQELLSLAQKTEASFHTQNAYEQLWKIYNKKKDSANAYKYYVKYTALKDSTITGTFQRKLAIVNELDNEKEQQLQIAALDKDNKLKQSAIQKNMLIRNILLAGVAILILLAFIIYRVIELKRKNEKHLRELAENELKIQKLESGKKETELKHQASELKLQALRAQMNPHFIFNCLNSINRFIINSDGSKAADYLTKFAKLIRIVLEQSGKSFVVLEDELKCLQLYMDLEKLRFEIPFQYEINCNGIDVSSLMIPTLLIQPFVENAIWHGLQGTAHNNGKINIDMYVQDTILHCKIYDNGIGRAASEIKEKREAGKTSLGINITQHRLQLIDTPQQHESGIEIHDLVNEEGYSSGTCVDIKIPVKEI
ncbi:MAG: histidine kinase [Parafilimonas sp.]